MSRVPVGYVAPPTKTTSNGAKADVSVAQSESPRAKDTFANREHQLSTNTDVINRKIESLLNIDEIKKTLRFLYQHILVDPEQYEGQQIFELNTEINSFVVKDPEAPIYQTTSTSEIQLEIQDQPIFLEYLRNTIYGKPSTFLQSFDLFIHPSLPAECVVHAQNQLKAAITKLNESQFIEEFPSLFCAKNSLQNE